MLGENGILQARKLPLNAYIDLRYETRLGLTQPLTVATWHTNDPELQSKQFNPFAKQKRDLSQPETKNVIQEEGIA